MTERTERIYEILEDLLEVRKSLVELTHPSSPASRSIALSITRVDEAMMWLKNEIESIERREKCE